MKRHAIYTGIAKTEVELQRLREVLATRARKRSDTAKATNPGILYVIMRKEIETGDLRRFLANFGPLVEKDRLRQIAGSISFTVHGYDDREEEIFEIPEVRAYFQAAHRRWPCWLFTADIRTACLHAVILSILPTVNIIRAPAQGINQAQASYKHLKTFFMDSLVASSVMEVKAGISANRSEKRIEALAEYLGL